MAVLIVRDAKAYMAGFELTGQIRSLALDYGAEPLDATTLGSTTRTRTGGLKTVAFSHQGFWNAASASSAIDPIIYNRLGTANVPVTVAPQLSSDGSLAYLFRALHTEFSESGTVGELLGYGVTAEGDEDLVRGVVARNSTLVGSSNGAGTAFFLGSSTDKTVHASLHVLDVTNPTSSDALVVVLQSAGSSGMGGATTRITFTATTGGGGNGEWQSFTAGTTDEWWRQTTTAPTSSGKYSFIVSAGLSTL